MPPFSSLGQSMGIPLVANSMPVVKNFVTSQPAGTLKGQPFSISNQATNLVLVTTPLLTTKAALIGNPLLVLSTTPLLTTKAALIGHPTLILSTTPLLTTKAALVSSISLVLATTPLLTTQMAMDALDEFGNPVTLLKIVTTGDLLPRAALVGSCTFVIDTSARPSVRRIRGMSRRWVFPPARTTHTQSPFISRKQSGGTE